MQCHADHTTYHLVCDTMIVIIEAPEIFIETCGHTHAHWTVKMASRAYTSLFCIFTRLESWMSGALKQVLMK